MQAGASQKTVLFDDNRLQAPLRGARSEEHTSELQSRLHLVCRLLLEKKNNKHNPANPPLTTRMISTTNPPNRQNKPVRRLDHAIPPPRRPEHMYPSMTTPTTSPYNAG